MNSHLGRIHHFRGSPYEWVCMSEERQQTLYQYTPKEWLGTKARSVDGQYWSVEDLVQVVREQYGVEYQSQTSCSQLLRPCGFIYQKTEKVFKSRSETKVADFEEQLEKN